MGKRSFPESSVTAGRENSNLVVDPTATKVTSPTTVTVGALRNIYASTSAPQSTDGADGDIWVQYTA
jgi:hypothetical protein